MFLVRLLAVILLATGIGCANRSSEAADLEIAEPPLDSLRAALRELVTHPSCGDVLQCRSIAFGSKPCGGPWSYLIYSTQTADSAAIVDAVAKYNEGEARRNEMEGRSSDCVFVSAPQLECVESRCVAMR